MSLFHARIPSSAQFVAEAVVKLFTIFSVITHRNITLPTLSNNPSSAGINMELSKSTRLVPLPVISSYFKDFIAPFINEFLSHIYSCFSSSNSSNGGGLLDRNLLEKYVKVLSVTFTTVPTVPFATRLKEWEVVLYPLLMTSLLSSSTSASSLVVFQLQILFHFFSLLITSERSSTFTMEKVMELFPVFFTSEIEINAVKEIFSVRYDILQQSCRYNNDIFPCFNDNHGFILFSLSGSDQLLQEFINFLLSSSFQLDLKAFSTMIEGIISSSDYLSIHSTQRNQVKCLFSQNNIQQTLEMTKLQLNDMLSLWNQPLLEQNTQVLHFDIR
jgi:hypothetical protein